MVKYLDTKMVGSVDVGNKGAPLWMNLHCLIAEYIIQEKFKEPIPRPTFQF